MSDAFNLEDSWFSLPLNYLLIWDSNLTSILYFYLLNLATLASLLPPPLRTQLLDSNPTQPWEAFPHPSLFKAPSVSEILSQADSGAVGNASRAAACPLRLTSTAVLEWAGFPPQCQGCDWEWCIPGMLCVHSSCVHQFSHSFIHLPTVVRGQLCAGCPVEALLRDSQTVLTVTHCQKYIFT